MKRLLTIATALSLSLIGVSAPPASAFDAGDADCLTITDNVVTDGRACVGSIIIPAGVTSIGQRAFYTASSLTSITIPASVTSIQTEAFFRATSITSVTFASGSLLGSIGQSAFERATSLSRITIPAGVTSIGAFTFFSASSLASVTIPAGVTSIGAYAFYGASSLASITIPASVTSIDANAFYNASSLASVRFLGSAAPTIGSAVFLFVSANAKAIINPRATGFGIVEDGDRFGGLITEYASADLLATEAAASIFTALVDALPAVDTITSADAAAVTSARSAYTSLSDAAKALVTASFATLVAAETKIASLSASSAPTAEQLREAARLARIQREAEKIRARSELVSNSSAPLTLEKFVTAEIAGITADNFSAVSAEIAALAIEKRSDITEILKIARRYEVVDKISTNLKVHPVTLQEIGLIPQDSPYKSTLTAIVLKQDPTDRSSFQKVQAFISNELKKIETRQKRMEEIRRRLASR